MCVATSKSMLVASSATVFVLRLQRWTWVLVRAEGDPAPRRTSSTTTNIQHPPTGNAQSGRTSHTARWAIRAKHKAVKAGDRWTCEGRRMHAVGADVGSHVPLCVGHSK
jgi:hypothetical protein